MKSLISYLWPGGINTPTPRIDIWKMSPICHQFGYWPDGTKAGPNCPPKKQLHLYIYDGEYEGQPGYEEFYEYLYECTQNPELFNEAEYKRRFVE